MKFIQNVNVALVNVKIGLMCLHLDVWCNKVGDRMKKMHTYIYFGEI